MRAIPQSFTLRKDGAPSKGDWFSIQNKKGDDDTTEVMIYDEIGFWGTTAKDFVKKLNKIETAKISLRLNSPGGAIFDGVAIFNALLNHDAKVTVFVDALAASAASFIAQAGDEVIMAKGSVMMIHDGMAVCIGNEEDLLKTAETVGKLSNNIAGIYADRAGGSVEEWRDLMRQEMWYTAEEAVESNLADRVLENEDEEAEEATDQWDLSFFNYAGREKAPSPLLVRERIQVTNKETKMADRPAGTHDHGGVTAPGGTHSHGATTTTSGDNKMGSIVTPTFQGVTINGEVVTDPAKIQTAIAAFEASQKESTNANRRAFVEQLAKDNKILASDIPKTQEFALALGPEQYTQWSALYESAPAQSALGQMGQPANKNVDEPKKDDKNSVADQRVVHEATVAMLVASGHTKEQIEKTDAYQALQALDANQ